MKLVPRSFKIEKELWAYVGRRAKEVAKDSASKPSKSAFLRELIIDDKKRQSESVAA